MAHGNFSHKQFWLRPLFLQGTIFCIFEIVNLIFTLNLKKWPKVKVVKKVESADIALLTSDKRGASVKCLFFLFGSITRISLDLPCSHGKYEKQKKHISITASRQPSRDTALAQKSDCTQHLHSCRVFSDRERNIPVHRNHRSPACAWHRPMSAGFQSLKAGDGPRVRTQG